MSALNDLFDPIAKPAPARPAGQPTIDGSGIVRRADAIQVDILVTEPRSSYVIVAGDVMDVISQAHALSGKLIDVRLEYSKPRGAIDLASIAGRFHDGNEELWVSRPGHMPPDLIRFRGRFGYQKAVKMPRDHGSFGYIYWSWLETNAGELPGIDLGVILVPSKDRWYRVFTNKSDATAYYQS